MATVSTDRDRAKADRQTSLLREAARLFADRGYAGVSLEELGAAVGISGPAVYRHFAGKQALLGAILVRVSEGLRDGGREVVAAGAQRRSGWPAWCASMSTSRSASPTSSAYRTASSRTSWMRTATPCAAYSASTSRRGSACSPKPTRSHREKELRVRAHACFGLINSTPHSVRGLRDAPDEATVRALLESMALSAIS